MGIIWSKLEDRLVELTQEELRAFVDSLEEPEDFYGFGLLCNAACGEVLLCLNSTAGLQEAVEDRGNRSGIEDELRWSLGDWKYSDFASRRFRLAWADFQDQVENQGLDEDDNGRSAVAKRFMGLACRTLLRLEEMEAFAVLKQTPDWDVFACDAEEDEEDAWDRLERVRRDFEPSTRYED